MTLITMTELKMDLKKYTTMAKDDDVIITKNGKPFVKLTSVSSSKMDIVNELAGCITLDKTYEELMDERYSNI